MEMYLLSFNIICLNLSPCVFSVCITVYTVGLLDPWVIVLLDHVWLCHLISIAWIYHHDCFCLFLHSCDIWIHDCKYFYHHDCVFLIVMSSGLWLTTSLVSLPLSIRLIHGDELELDKRSVDSNSGPVAFNWRSLPEGTFRWYIMLLAFHWNK